MFFVLINLYIWGLPRMDGRQLGKFSAIFMTNSLLQEQESRSQETFGSGLGLDLTAEPLLEESSTSNCQLQNLTECVQVRICFILLTKLIQLCGSVTTMLQ